MIIRENLTLSHIIESNKECSSVYHHKGFLERAKRTGSLGGSAGKTRQGKDHIKGEKSQSKLV